MHDHIHSQIREVYLQACEIHSDVHLHLPILKAHADLCDHVTEFGVRDGQSSRALWASKAAHIRMYDLELNDQVTQHVTQLKLTGRDVTYTQANTLNLTIEPTHMLFVDTLHTYDQLKQELRVHAPQVSRFMAFHDTQTFGTRDESNNAGPGLLPALLEWLSENPAWRICYHDYRNNGFTVIENHNPL
jgi:hypothetical protein